MEKKKRLSTKDYNTPKKNKRQAAVDKRMN